jgi:ABC-type polysaccharide/polyol phosphate transport system ATPase subunit
MDSITPDHDIQLTINNIWKRYGLPFVPSLRQKIDRITRRDKPIEAYGPWALREINIDIRRGETLGIIGHNGAGKSTLLKALAGVTRPTYGEIVTHGRIFPMIELNAGLHNDLTGRQNIYMLGAIMGLTREQVSDRIESIKEFSELNDWFEQPVRKYSSGMLTRLGFSVAINVDADVLLIDEVLSVGDITFQRKCFDHMERLQSDQNVTMVFVSHGIRQVERLCERTALLDHGRLVAFGKTSDVVAEYYERSNQNIIKHRTQKGDVVGRFVENPLIMIQKISLFDQDGNECDSFQTGDKVIIEIEYDAPKAYDDVIVGVGIATIDSFYVAGMSNEGDHLFKMSGQGKFTCEIEHLPLLNGIYMIHVKLRSSWGLTYGGGYGLSTFSVTVASKDRLSSDYGLINIDANWANQTLSSLPESSTNHDEPN